MRRLLMCLLGFAMCTSPVAGSPLISSSALRHALIGPKQPSFSTVYTFKGGIDGDVPAASLVNLKGVFYGTTALGGAYAGVGDGTVFSVTTSGVEHVLHRFAAYPVDGQTPRSGLVAVNGYLYGTTPGGGANNGGILYRVTTSGTENVLFSFGSSGSAGGCYPNGTLIAEANVLYGTAGCGAGAYNAGVVFAASVTGSEHVFYAFKGVNGDAGPTGALVDANGVLYGIASNAVFDLTTHAVEHVLHAFNDTTDGEEPEGIVVVNGSVYGTTYYGGAYGYGTVFALSPAGVEHVIHSFTGGADGGNPKAALIAYGGVLYGTTSDGGTFGQGTVFRMTTSGSEEVLHTFTGGSDGANPWAPLTEFDGVLFGTTTGGGLPYCYGSGCGTVFKVAP